MRTDDLIKFLEARIDKDEQVALDAAGLGDSGRTWKRDMIGCVVRADRSFVVWSDGTTSPWAADHIAHYDPDRALREVKAKRAIIAEHRVEDPDETWRYCAVCHDPIRHDAVSAPCRTLRLLALPYDDHPDYREEWQL